MRECVAYGNTSICTNMKVHGATEISFDIIRAIVKLKVRRSVISGLTPHLTSPHFTSLHLTSPHFTSLHLTSLSIQQPSRM